LPEVSGERGERPIVRIAAPSRDRPEEKTSGNVRGSEQEHYTVRTAINASSLYWGGKHCRPEASYAVFPLRLPGLLPTRSGQERRGVLCGRAQCNPLSACR